MKTNNRVALITGANRGLGLQTARELGKIGITLLLGVRDVSNSQEALKELKGLGYTVEAIPLDVSDIYCRNYVTAKSARDTESSIFSSTMPGFGKRL
jgi:NAD(P)-dependent dehydrogenase (short-subunit alcohol dehydrogenase family)